MDFIEELKWRGLFYDMIPGTDKYLTTHQARGYIGFDPTAPSLGIGNLVQIIILRHFQRAGHTPIAVIGGATGMIGDPSGKSAERNLLTTEQLQHNQEKVKQQLAQLLDFEEGPNKAIMVNNYDWFKDINVLSFLRDVGKHLTISYMMAKDSVKNRLESGISFTEFSYQLLQGYDFYHLYTQYDCPIQLGGSDQWGNLTSGVELIRRMAGGEAYAVTSPLVTKTDGTKFGKSEQGNIYLSPDMTSPYKFYQFWLNVSDADAEKFIKIFTFLDRPTIEGLIEEHQAAPHLRKLQHTLAEYVTTMVHSEAALTAAKNASQILFGKSTKASLQALSNTELLDVFEGVPMYEIARDQLTAGTDVLSLVAEYTPIFNSKGEARRLLKDNGVRLNKEVIQQADYLVTTNDLINDRFILVQKGKKNYFLVEAT